MMEDKLERGSPVGEGGASPVAPSSPVVEETAIIVDEPHRITFEPVNQDGLRPLGYNVVARETIQATLEAPQAGERAPLPDDVRMKLSTLLEALWRESADLERKSCLRIVEEMASTIRGPARNLLDIAAKGIRKRSI